jgi:hypothetical protein
LTASRGLAPSSRGLAPSLAGLDFCAWAIDGVYLGGSDFY